MPTRVSARRGRRKSPGVFRLKKPVWIDPHPEIPGTEPEKRLFDALYRRRIYFIFQGELPEFKEKDLPVLWQVGYKPDFVLPEYRVIIDPFGVFHHSLPEAIKRDEFKSVIYRALGYSFYHPWWSERGFEWSDGPLSRGLKGGRRLTTEALMRSLDVQREEVKRSASASLTPLGNDAFGVLDRIPELRLGIRFPLKNQADIDAKRLVGYRLGKFLGAGASSVALANSKRKRAPVIGLRSPGRRRRRRR